MLAGILPILALALAAEPSAIAPSVSADLDGDGRVETVRASASRGSVKLEVTDPAGRRLSDAKAPAPPGAVVPLTLTTAPVGSAGALVVLTAATDSMVCRTVWRFRDGTLSLLPIRDAKGKALPDCSPPGWKEEFRKEEGAPAFLVREKTEKTTAGTLRTRETYAFAGFSLDFDAARSSSEIEGIPIPSWFAATLYTRGALETLYGRYGLAAMRAETTLRIVTDASRAVFELRFDGKAGPVLAPVQAYAKSGDTATLSLRGGAAGSSAQAIVRLSGEKGDVPLEVQVTGMGAGFDGLYSPAGSWRGGARQVFAGAADEIASEQLAGMWTDARGKSQTIATEGDPPYRVRMEGALYRVDMEHAAAPVDLLLLPDGASGRPWGVVLRGANGIERIPLVCTGEGAAFACRNDGDGEILRRMGARVNVH